MKRIRIAFGLLASLVLATESQAEFREVRQTIYGMDWAVCAHAVSVAIRKIEGVASVDVSLNGGFADVKLKPGNRVDPERIRQVARDNGFTPKGADVKVAGQIVERGGKLALEVRGLDDVVYLLVEHPEAKGKLAEAHKAAGKAVVVTGHLPETAIAPKPDAPHSLQLRDLTVEDKWMRKSADAAPGSRG